VSAVLVLLAEVRAAGADIGLDGGVLRVRVPKGVLTAVQREQLIEHHAAIIRLLTELAAGHYGPDEVVADLKAVFADDRLASQAAAERLAKTRVADGPIGDDLPAWQIWMNHRYAYWRRRGFSRAEAMRIVWGEAEWEWHKRHGPLPDPDRCAGCGKRILGGEGMRLLDGAVVHVGDPEVVECLAIYGAQYRSAASAGLVALGLRKPA
jgi:hypothetical protein